MRKFEYFSFNSVLLSFLCFDKLRAYIVYSEQKWSNCQANIPWFLSGRAWQIGLRTMTINFMIQTSTILYESAK
jgi:hypothetical protein